MIVRAAVKFDDLRRNTVITIPCHRHCDAFMIMKEFGYNINEYKQIEQGFLTETGLFLNRMQAMKHARECGQVNSIGFSELYSEDLW